MSMKDLGGGMNQQKENTRQPLVNKVKAPTIQVVINGRIERMRFVFDRQFPIDGEKA